MGTLLKITIIGVTLDLLGESIMQFVDRMKIFNVVEPIELPNCRLVKGIEFGSEDIELLPNGLAFISSGLKYPLLKSFAPDKPGEILLIDLNDEDPLPVPLSISEGFDASSLNPHGMSIYIDQKDGTVYLLVVNHPHHNTAIEIFIFAEKENLLIHLKTIQHELLHSVNDIVAVGPESFYATNDFYFTSIPMRFVEAFLGLTWTNVVYYSPGDVREVAAGLYSANGITISRDKKYVYVVDLTAHTISVFEKNSNWSLSLVKVVPVGVILDNLSVEPVTGDIWTGAHPSLYKVFFYNPEDLPGTEVVRIQNIHSDNPVITKVYVNNGSVIQASSCAVVYGNKLLVGTVFHRALYCLL